MVNLQTYRQLHSDELAFRRTYDAINKRDIKRMESTLMEGEDPPPDPQIYAFPSSIIGYNLHSKKWGTYSRCHSAKVPMNTNNMQWILL